MTQSGIGKRNMQGITCSYRKLSYERSEKTYSKSWTKVEFSFATYISHNFSIVYRAIRTFRGGKVCIHQKPRVELEVLVEMKMDVKMEVEVEVEVKEKG